MTGGGRENEKVPSLARADSQRRVQRSGRFFLTASLVISSILAIVALTPVGPRLALATRDVAWVAGIWITSLGLSHLAYHRFGGQDRRYLVVAGLEVWCFVFGLMWLVHRSKPDSVLWFAYIAIASINGSASQHRGLLRFGVALGPSVLTLVYLVVDRDAVAAGITVLAGAFALVAFQLQAMTASQLDELARQYDEQAKDLAELRAREERARIARDLHDGVAADLAAIALRAQRLMAQAPDDAALSTIATRAAEGLEDLRASVWGLEAGEKTLGAAFARAAARAEQLATPETRVVVDWVDDPATVSGDDATHVQRIVDEAVRNAVRHARASEVRVVLRGEPLDIAIEDDGRGTTGPAGRGAGLGNIRSRAAALGCEVEIGAREGGGTRIVVRRKG